MKLVKKLVDLKKRQYDKESYPKILIAFLSLQTKAINKADKVISLRIIDDPEQYRRFFFKLDKAIFIGKEKL